MFPNRKMKILGYIDDGITWFVHWQNSIGWWNLFVIPFEILFIMWAWLYVGSRTS